VIALIRVVSFDVIEGGQVVGYSCSFGLDKESFEGERESRFVQRSKTRYKSNSPGKGTSAIKGTVLGPGHETCRGHVAGRLQRVVRRYPLISQRYLALELAPVGVVQCRPDDGMERDDYWALDLCLTDNWLIPVCR